LYTGQSGHFVLCEKAQGRLEGKKGAPSSPVEIGQDGRRFGGDFSVLSSRFCLDLDNNEREWLLAFIASTFYKGPVKLFKKEKVCIYLFLSLYLHFSRSSARATQ
jgi:hypothetical protein